MYTNIYEKNGFWGVSGMSGNPQGLKIYSNSSKRTL